MAKFWKVCALLSRFCMGLIFFMAGMSKLIPFPGIIGPVWLAEALEPHGLGLYANFIAVSQIVIGLLLFTQRFATLGAIMLFPMLANILMITISLGWQGTPYVILFLLANNIFLLLYDWHRLKVLITDDVEGYRKTLFKRTRPQLDVLWLLGMGVVLVAIPLHGWNSTASYAAIGVGLLIFVVVQVLQHLGIKKKSVSPE